MSGLEAAQEDFNRKDHRLKIGLGILVGYVVILLTFLAIQTFVIQTTIADNQAKNATASEQRFARYTEDNAKQHRITQAYIKCIANALLVPVEQRSPGVFDQCGITAKDKEDTSSTGGSDLQSFLTPTNQTSVLPSAATSNPASNTPPTQPEQPAPSNVVAGAPPDPNTPLLSLQPSLGLPLQLRVGDILRLQTK